MRCLDKLSIRGKLLGILMLTSTAGLLTLGLALVGNDVLSFYDDQKRDLGALANVLGRNSAAPLTFADPQAAAEILRGLRFKPDVVQACLFDSNGKLFERYDRDGQQQACISDPGVPVRVTRNGIAISTRINWKDEYVGFLYLRSDFSSLRPQLEKYLAIVLAVVSASVLIAFVLGLRLQRVISTPIIGLAHTAARVSAEKNYSLRAEPGGADELGLLTSRFNEMLTEIEMRDSELHRHRERLQREVELERRLNAASEQLRAVLQSTQDCVIAVDKQLQITYANRLPDGADAAAAVGQHFFGICPHLPLSTFVERLQKALQDGVPTQFDEYCPSTHAWFTVMAFPSPGGLLLFLRDITEKRALEDQFRHAQKMEAIGQLASGIAHEINTPVQYVGDNTTFLGESWSALVPVFSAARKMREEAGNGGISRATLASFDETVEKADLDCLMKEVPTAIEQSLEGIRRTAKIVRAMKEFSHPGAEEKCLADINHSIETTLTVARNAWKYVAEVNTIFEPELPLVPCYLGEFNQVVLNLIINAADAIREVVGDAAHDKGRITITTRSVPNHVEIAIQDTGAGIPEKIRPRVFDPFFTTKQVGKGTGQGLALAHSVIVKKHGGQIWFESELKKGTTFFVRLPLCR